MKIKVCLKPPAPSGNLRRIVPRITSPKVYEALIKQRLGLKMGIMDGCMDTDAISPRSALASPVMFEVLSANVNERKVLDTKKDKLIERGVRCIVADKGYVDKKRAAAFAEVSKVLLLTPKTPLAAANPLLGADPLYTATQIETWRAARKTAIEPVFDLLSRLLSITGAHKPLPMRGLPYVATFLGLGVLVLQLAMLMNHRCGLPKRGKCSYGNRMP